MFGKNMPDFSHGPVAVIGENIDISVLEKQHHMIQRDFVGLRHDARQRFDNGHRCAAVGKMARRFAADLAAADDNDVLVLSHRQAPPA